MLALEERSLVEIVGQAPYLYSAFRQPKKSGGFRLIRPPSRRLRVVQRRILRALEPRVRYPRWMTGGVPRRCILRHAEPHVGRMMVATLDLESFFPSVKRAQVDAVFQRFGIGGPARDALVRLTTLDGQLPQGSPASCFLANLVMEAADRRIDCLCRKHKLSYSRYIDDLAISGDRDLRPFQGAFTQAIVDHGFAISPKKPMRFMDRSGPQEVTNLLVNDRMRPTKGYIADLQDEIWECLRGVGPRMLAIEKGISVGRLRARLRGRVGYIDRFDPPLARTLRGRLLGVAWEQPENF